MSNFPNDKNILLFDGLCNFCNGTVQFLLKWDRQDRFRFAALQSGVASRVLENFPDLTELPDSFLLIRSGKIYFKSNAVLKIAEQLPFPWFLFSIFRILPHSFRDAIYDWIARHRYQWFGRQSECKVPPAEQRKKFLE